MTKRILIAIALATAALFAVSAFALSEPYEQFGNGPAQFIMTKDEAAQWKAIKTDDAAKSFIDAFWARRGTAFKEEFDQRVKYADEHFAEGRRKGSTTDRGRVLITLGGPAKVMKTPVAITAAPRANATDLDQETADRPRARQVWTYEAGKTPNLGIPVLEVAFVDSLNSGDWKLERTRASGDYNVIFEKVNVANSTANVAQTTTTTTTTTTETTKTTTGPAAAVAPATLKNPAYQAAVDAQKAGTSAINKNVSSAYSELVAPTGEFYVPIELYISKSSPLTPDSADTFFGLVEDASGKAVYSFEEPAKLTTSKDEQFVDKSITLPTGKYNAYIGLAKGDNPVAIATRPLEINEVAKDATGTSKLILSNNMYETEKAAPVKSPFAFGRLKVVPKANLSFTTADELTYFVEIHNPGIDAATSLPKIQVKLELTGGKLTKPIPRPLSDITALPLSGAPGPGQYAIIDSIQLDQIKSALAPGDYVLKVKIVDTVSKQTYNLEQAFKITS
jgi:GWxTD domain-containing protein